MNAGGTLRRVLVATERTEFDRGAERVAIALAARLGAALQIVLPFATNEELLSTEPVLALQSEQQAAANLSRLADEARAQGVPATPTVRRGAVLWQEIVAAAADGADLLITRRVGRRGLLARLLVGEMVSRVAAHAPCPMLMVPADTTGLWSRRIICATAAGRAVEAAVPVLAGAGGAAVERRGGSIGEMAAAAGAGDLLVLGLNAAQVAGGHLAGDVVAAIGAAPCPVALVGPALRADR